MECVRQAGIVGTGTEALQKLRALPPELLLAKLNLATLRSYTAATWVGGPVLDGKIMPELPSTAYAEGEMAHVPLMVGANQLMVEPARPGTAWTRPGKMRRPQGPCMHTGCRLPRMESFTLTVNRNGLGMIYVMTS